VSLPLGCVRMTEKFVADPAAPFAAASADAIGRHVSGALLASGFPMPVPARVVVVGTGGTLATVREMVAAEQGGSPDAANPLIGVALLRRMLAKVGPMDLAARGAVRGLAAARADVFPAALATLLALADLGSFQAFHFSLRSLRWGIAAEYLG